METKNILKKYEEFIINSNNSNSSFDWALSYVLIFLSFVIPLALLVILWLGFIKLIGARTYILLCIGGVIAFFVWIHKHEQTEEYQKRQTKELKEHFDRTSESRAQLKSFLDKYHKPEK